MRRISAPVAVGGCLVGCLLAATGCGPAGGDNPGSGGSNGAAGTGGSTAGAGGGTAGTGGGTAGTGGGTAGSGGSNGAAGTGGSTAGSTGRGGGTGGGGATGAAGSGGGSGNCTFTQSSSLSTRIGTVGIVMWTTTLANATSAKIDFGLTTAYGMTAPVGTVSSMNRTLLLGMKTQRLYNYRITAMSGSTSCASENYTIMSGSLPTGLMRPTMAPATSSVTGLSGGFLITAQFQGTPVTAFILDADGDYVWAYANAGTQLTGARMNWAGTHMWINSANVPGPNAHNVRRVTMDGLMEENLTSQFTSMNHQLTVLPDETVAFYAYGANDCDDVKERAPDGTVRTIVNSRSALRSNAGMCHLNNIQYSMEDDSLVFSNLQSSQVAKVKRSDGSTVWILNGSSATITGISWVGGNHGIHLLGLNRLLLFVNNSPNQGGTGPSMAKEYMFSGTSGMEVWSYTASPSQPNMVMGDLQRMPNGNTVVAYSTRGVIDEVNAQGQLLQRLTTAGAGSTFGYIEKRATLYGPPPR